MYWDFDRKWQSNVPFTYTLWFHSNSIQTENISARLFCWCRTTCLLYWIALLSSILFNRIENYYWPISCIFNFFVCCSGIVYLFIFFQVFWITAFKYRLISMNLVEINWAFIKPIIRLVEQKHDYWLSVCGWFRLIWAIH